MKKEQILSELIQPNLSEGEELIGFFQVQHNPKFRWTMIFGSASVLAMKLGFIAVTNKGFQLHWLTVMGKAGDYEFFPWESVTGMKLTKGMMRSRLIFNIDPERTLGFYAQVKALKGVPVLTEEVRSYLHSRFS